VPERLDWACAIEEGVDLLRQNVSDPGFTADGAAEGFEDLGLVPKALSERFP